MMSLQKRSWDGLARKVSDEEQEGDEVDVVPDGKRPSRGVPEAKLMCTIRTLCRARRPFVTG